jgi:SagB-type dehydrogenase family enzyme
MNEKDDFTALNGQEYQDITVYDRLHMPRHSMDWSNVPNQIKSYPALPTVMLDKEVGLTEKPFWQVMQGAINPLRMTTFDIPSLSTVLGLAYGYTARQRAGSQTYLYRSAPSAGALYPVEIYFCGEGIPGLQPGLFHYDIQDFSLQQLRGEDAMASTAAALSVPKSESGWASFILSGIFFRSAWKYSKRAFRYVLLDTGHLLENLVSSREKTYDVIEGIYHTSSERRKQSSPSDKVSLVTLPEPGEWYPVRHQDIKTPGAAYAGVLQSRRSRRNFVREPIPVGSFMRLLSLVGTTPSSDIGAEPCVRPVTTGFIVGQVEGFDRGYYQFSNEGRAYGLLKSGSYVEKMAGICLDQLWLANAGALFLFMTNLRTLDEVYGARGYRYAMMDAGILGQRLYLGSTALGLGCCGIGAFYDHEAQSLLDLNDDSYLLYLVAVGKIKK